MSEAKQAVCSCGLTVKLPSRGLPRGWHRKGEEYFCAKCWQERYYLRTVTMPVRSPLDCSWEELDVVMRSMWLASTACSNWMISELRMRDETQARSVKFQRMPKVVLYASARERFPELPAQSIVALEQSIQRKYRAVRADVIWRRSASLPSFRYPTPFPVHNQSWSTETDDGGRPIVSARIGDQRLRLRLGSGHQFKRQMLQFKAMHSGDAPRGELAILNNPDGKLMVKMVGWFEKRKQADKNGTIFISTQKDRLLEALDAKSERIWNYNADHLNRWVGEHKRNLERWSEDAKFENRPVQDFARRRRLAVQKFTARMHSRLHQIADEVAGFANRRKCATVQYDGTEKGYGDLQWYKLESLVKEKLDALGIEFVSKTASGEAPEESGEALATEETQ